MNFQPTSWRRKAADSTATLTTTPLTEEETLARRRKRRNLLIGFLALLVAAIIVFAALADRSGETAAVPAAGGEGGGTEAAPAVTVAVPGRQQVARTISATGTLAARRDLPVGVPGEGGQVVRVLVEPGQWVRAGQVLAVIDRSVQSQEASQLAAQIEVHRADLALAQSELDRAQALVARGFVSQADIQRKTAARDAAAARVRVAQAQLGGTRARIGRLDVRAPAAGLVLARSVEAGQVVGPGSGALFRIAQGGEMELLAQLAEHDLALIRIGIPATVTPVGSDASFAGSVWQVAPIINPQTRQGYARISVPYNQALRPGGFAQAQLSVGGIDAPLLPESAVLNDQQGHYVYVVGAENRVERRPVQVGSVTDRGVVIVDGLAGNERVVLTAGAFLNPGEQVRPELTTLGN